MAKQLNINLSFQADTSKAKAQIQELQTALNKIGSMGAISNDSGIQEAAKAAKELSYHLNKAFNANTGNLDLSKFNASLSKSNTNVTKLSTQLLQAGTTGKQAFMNLAQSISTAEYPMLRINSRMQEFMVTLKNTARWQISSSILHGFMGAIQNAYGYAQNLNQSLNNIRIVTGYSADQMAQFADQANRAAQSLSTTTTEYTDAALIYYQQGIRDQSEIEERTATTIKLANVSRQSAEEVSQQMTAIWNNFYDGSQNLEYYADAITALGASTASSSEEIATGLEKFAAVSKTVGLSYEYATAALATITAQTRQSADTVGTGLRTLFARLESLKLGESLEDGVDLNKYSKALHDVGVEVLDTSGQMRNMDNILDDLATKWDTLEQAQKMALAQTVGGVRQYTNLIALMDNWDKMQQNILTAKNSEGTLQEQAKIYEESWEAARDRVKNALQGIYQDLLDDKFFISLNDTFASALKGINAFIDGIGGLKTIIIGVGSLLLSYIADKIGPALNTLKYNLQVIFTGAQTQAQKTIMQMNAMLEKQKTSLGSTKTDPNNASEIQQLTNIQQLTIARSKLMMETKNLSDEERNMAEFQLQGIASQQQHVQTVADEVSALENLNIKYREQLDNGSKADGIVKESTSTLKEFEAEINSIRDAMMEEDAEIDQLEQELAELYEITDIYKDATEQTKILSSDMAKAMGEEAQTFLQTNQSLQTYSKTISAIVGIDNDFTKQTDIINNRLQQLSKSGALTDKAFEEIRSEVELLIKVIPKTSKNAEELRRILSKLITTQVNRDVDGFVQILEQLKTTFNNAEVNGNNFKNVMQQIAGTLGEEYLASLERAAQKQRELEEENRKLNQAFQEFDPTHTVTGIERVGLAASTLGQVSMMINSLRNLISVWNNDDLTFGEKLTSAFMSISMIVPSVITVFGNLGKIMPGLTSSFSVYTAGLKLVDINQKEVTASLVTLTGTEITAEATEKALAITKSALLAASKAHGVAITAETAATIASAIASNLKAGMGRKEAIQSALTTAGINAETAAKIAATMATQGLTAAINGMLGPIGWAIAALTALITVLTLVSNHYKKVEEAAMESAKQQAAAIDEVNKKNREETDSFRNLYNAYLEAKKGLDGSETSKKNFRDATEKLCDALGVEYNALDALQGKYENLDKVILKTREDKIRGFIDDAQKSREVFETNGQEIHENSAGYTLYKAAGLEENRTQAGGVAYYNYASANPYGSGIVNTPEFRFGGYSGVGWHDKQMSAQVVYKAIDDYLQENYTDIYDKAYYNGQNTSVEWLSGFDFANGTTDAQVFTALHDALANINWKDSQYQTSEAQNALNGLKNIFSNENEFGKAYSDYMVSLKQEKEFQTELITNLLAQEGLWATEVTTDNYDEYRNKFIATAQKEFNMMENEALDLFDNYAGIIAQEIKSSGQIIKATGEVAKKTGIDEDIIEQYRKQYGDELFFSINFDTIKSEYSLKQQLNYLQGIADKNSIKTQFELIDSNKKDLKKDMSADDYAKFYESSGIAWGQEGPNGEKIIEYSEFLQKSYDEQVEYYNKVYDIYEQTYLKSLEENKKATEYNIQLTKIKQQSALENIKNVKSGIESFLQSKINLGDLLGDFDSNELLKIFDSVDSSNMEDSLDRIEKFFIGTKYYTDSWNPDFWKSLINQMINAKNSVEGYSDELVKLEKTNNDLDLESKDVEIRAIINEKELKDKYDNILEELSKKTISIGMEFTQEEVADLASMGINWQDYFAPGIDGIYTLINGENELRDLIQDKAYEQYVHGLNELENQRNELLIKQQSIIDNLHAAEQGMYQLDGNYKENFDAYLQLGIEAGQLKEQMQQMQEALNFSVWKQNIQETGLNFEETSRYADRAINRINDYNEVLKETGEYGKQVSDDQKDVVKGLMNVEKSARDAAIANQRLNRGIQTLCDNYDDWIDVLQNGDKTSIEYSKTLDTMKETLADLLNVFDQDLFSDKFIESLDPEVLKKIADGDIDALNSIRTAAAEDIVQTLLINVKDEELYNQLSNLWIGANSLLDQYGDLEIGTHINGTDEFVTKLNELIAATGMTKDQVNSLLGSMGMSAELTEEYKDTPTKIPVYTTEEEIQTTPHEVENGDTTSTYTTVRKTSKTYVSEYEDAIESVPVVAIKTTAADGTSSGGGIDIIGATATPTKSGGVNKSNIGGYSKKPDNKTSKKETKEHKNLVDEKERYHVINQQIERQSNLLDRLSKSKDRAFGPQKQKWYTQELKSLKDMGKMYEEHLRQSTAYLAQDKATMQAWGAQISAKDGTILNYDALLKAQVDAYNRAVDRYNASKQTDADKDALKAAEDRFEKFQNDLKQYEDTVKTHEEDINNYIDNMIEQYDTMRAKTADAIEFRIEYDDSILDFLDKLIDRLDSWNGSMFAAVDIMGKLNDKTGALIQKNKDLETATAETLEHFLMDYKEFDAQGNIIYQTGMSKADSDAFINRFNTGGLTSEDIEMLAHMPEEERQLLMDYAEQRQDNTDALIETAQAVVDDVERQFNDAKDELAEAAKPIASATAALDNYAAIIDIVGADYLGVTDDIMQRFRDQQWNVLHETTMSNKAIMESLAAQRDMIEQEMNNALANGNDELAEMYREKLKGINDEVQSATEAWYSSWQAELSKLEEDFEKHIDEIKTKALDLAAGDAGTWQSLKDTMDYAQQAAERFLPEYKEIYEFSKLNRDINKSIDDTDNIKNKQALKKLQDEINKLQEKSGQISQYDLDNARRRYELELARLALEESRNAKEVVRLSKDSEGNWSYIYTASEEDVANAEQNYEDKLFAMQQANADYINDLQGQLTQATEDYYNKVAEINLIYKDDDEKRREELEKARMQYEETMQYYGGELQKAMDNNKQLYDEDWAWYSDYTQKINDDQGYRLGELENYVTKFDDTMLGMATGYDSVVAFEDDLLDHSIDTLGQMDDAYEHWSEQIHFSMEEAGTSVEDFAGDMMEQVDHVIVPKAEEARDSVEDLGEVTVDIMAEMVDAASQWRVSYSAAMDAIIAKNDAVKRSIQQVISALSALKTAEIGHDTTTGKTPEGAGKAGPTTSSPTKTSTTPSTGAGSTSGTGTSGSTTPTTKTTKTTPHVVETGYRYQNDETCMGYTKYSDGTETHNAGGHDKKFDHWEDNDAKYICTKCKHMWTVKNARGRGGCFAAGTKIMLPTRELKNIEEVKLGEEILAYNIETESFENKVVNMIYFKRGYNEMANIELSNGNILTMTLGHPLLTTQGWKSLDLENSNFEHGVQNATLLSVGDMLIGYDKPVMVNNINIYPVDKDYIVYCLGVDGYHNFIANDIIVHNALYAQITKFATGGYTGDFGNPNEGKLAVLHNKELVLNKDDTEHILNAVDMVRSISKTIDAYAMTNQFTIGNLTAARGVNPINGQMEQSVTITAEFPNATDRNEIAEAFNTLINQASQYANRKY